MGSVGYKRACRARKSDPEDGVEALSDVLRREVGKGYAAR
jgi:hypothetical protein